MKRSMKQLSLAARPAYWLTQLLFTLVLTALTQPGSAAQDPWPRELKAKAGTVIIYQPQLETFEGDKLTARAAVSVQKTDMKAPLFGVVWFDSRVTTDRDRRLVEFQEIKVAKIKFPNAEPEQERKLAVFLEQKIAAWEKPGISLDRLLAALAEVEKVKSGTDYRNDPPVILFRKQPSVLVLIDGQPILRDVEGFPVKRVVNTPFVLLLDPADNKYYLTGDALWFAAPDLQGPWQTLAVPPTAVADAAGRIAEAEVPTKVRPETLKAEQAPEIVVATEPTELIVSDGEPQFAPLEGTDLLYLSNSGRDVFQEVGSQQYYLLLSGRWFASPSLEQGPWTYVPSEKLPAGFYRIPAASVKGHVLAFIADTPQAKEAVADAQIPVTAAIPRTATTKIKFDGDPQFKPIEGTQLQYAVNTDKPVIKTQDKYYAVDQAVWYQSSQAAGDYQVTTEVPKEIYQIPPSSPVYNVTYVKVYQSTPQAVYVGYTPGYTGSYVTGGTVVYGTGYVYPPYVAPTVYYPAPVTYGYAPVYDPGYGAWNFLAGATFGFVAGAVASNWWGGCGCCGWHGDVDVDINRNVNISRNYVQNLNVNRANLRNTSLNRQNFQSLRSNRQDFRNNVYKNQNWSQQLQNNRRTQLNQRTASLQRGERPAGAQNRNLAGERQRPAGTQQRAGERQLAQQGRAGERQGKAAERQPSPAKTQARAEQRQSARSTQREQGPASTRQARTEQRAKPAELGKNNVFADRDGNVYRRSNQGWEQRDRSGWSRPQTGSKANPAERRSSLDRDFGSRARGTERTQSFQRAQGGGGHRGGGGRRH